MEEKLKIFTNLNNFIFAHFLAINLALGAPAFPGMLEFIQPDGSKFKGTQKGDEWFNWIETKDGDIVLRHRDNFQFQYAQIEIIDGSKVLAPSGIKVIEEKTDRAGKSKISNSSIKNIPLVPKKILYEMWKQARKNALKEHEN